MGLRPALYMRRKILLQLKPLQPYKMLWSVILTPLHLQVRTTIRAVIIRIVRLQLFHPTGVYVIREEQPPVRTLYPA